MIKLNYEWRFSADDVTKRGLSKIEEAVSIFVNLTGAEVDFNADAGIINAKIDESIDGLDSYCEDLEEVIDEYTDVWGFTPLGEVDE